MSIGKRVLLTHGGNEVGANYRSSHFYQKVHSLYTDRYNPGPKLTYYGDPGPGAVWIECRVSIKPGS